jgi:hypothetical protein
MHTEEIMNNKNKRNEIITNSDFLNTWKTSPGPVVVGILLTLLYTRIPLPDALLVIDVAIAIAYIIFSIFYALKIYPSYFSEKPMIRNNNTVSFLNGLCGGIIFGLIWNSNLTNKKKGVSNIVFVILTILAIVLIFLVVVALGMYMV